MQHTGDIPLRGEHRRFAWIVFRVAGIVWAAQHAAAPFGATASVHGWDQIGTFIAEAARRLLVLPALRYVDDYFGPEHPSTAEHAAKCFAELVVLLLGPGAVAPGKTDWGTTLVVLGLQLQALYFRAPKR